MDYRRTGSGLTINGLPRPRLGAPLAVGFQARHRPAHPLDHSFLEEARRQAAEKIGLVAGVVPDGRRRPRHGEAVDLEPLAEQAPTRYLERLAAHRLGEGQLEIEVERPRVKAPGRRGAFFRPGGRDGRIVLEAGRPLAGAPEVGDDIPDQLRGSFDGDAASYAHSGSDEGEKNLVGDHEAPGAEPEPAFFLPHDARFEPGADLRIALRRRFAEAAGKNLPRGALDHPGPPEHELPRPPRRVAAFPLA